MYRTQTGYKISIQIKIDFLMLIKDKATYVTRSCLLNFLLHQNPICINILCVFMNIDRLENVSIYYSVFKLESNTVLYCIFTINNEHFY